MTTTTNTTFPSTTPLPQIFQQTTSRFKSKTQYQRHITQSQRKYQLKVYRVGSMTRQQAIINYIELQTKYQNHVYQCLPYGWYENQRRLFVWFVVCYGKWNIIDANDQSLWLKLSEVFFDKDPRLLKYQYMNVLKRQGRVRWTHEQDQILKTSYNKHASGEWNEIAKQLFFNYPQTKNFKTPKNCRQRWNNHLNNEVKKQPFCQQQDIQLLRSIKQKGKKWSLIAKQMGNKRTQHQIKNRFNSLIGQYSKLVNNNNTNSNNNNSESNKSTKKHPKSPKIQQQQQQQSILLSNNNTNNNNNSENNIIDMLLRQLQKKNKLLSNSDNDNENNLCINDSNGNNIKITINSNNNNRTSSKKKSNNKNTNNNNKSFPFLNSINVIKQTIQHQHQHQQQQFIQQQQQQQKQQQPQSQSQSQQHPFLSYNNNNINTDNFLNPNNKRSSSTFPILLKPSFESNQSQQQKRQYMTSGGMTLVYCGNNREGNNANVFDNLFDNISNGGNSNNRSINAVIEDKLFGTGSQWMSSSQYNKSENLFVQLTPCAFFQDSSYNEKKMSEFKLSQKGSFQKSQIAASMEYFRLPGSDMSQQYRILTSSTVNDNRMSGPMIYQFSNDIKQL